MPYLPINKAEMLKLKIKQPDFVYVIGDAYVDHSAFGPAIISRVLVSHGYSVCIISQPDWKSEESIKIYGKPRLGFLVSSGNMDSMVNHYTVAGKRRSSDAYTPGGKTGKRPDYALSVYGNLIRKVYKDSPIIIGGIEASLRRLGHYDYWSDRVKRSILLDSCADILIYGMGEKAVVEIADCLNSGLKVSELSFINGCVYKSRNMEGLGEYIKLPEFDTIQNNKEKYAESFLVQYKNTDPFSAKILIEEYPHKVYIIQNPPQKPLSMQEMDDIYELPYMRDVHPEIRKIGHVTAIDEIKFSITSNRGCFGGCHFCSLNFHQGKIVQTRSHESIIREAIIMTKDPDFKGYIHDVGGPTAEFRRTACDKQLTNGACLNKSCLGYEHCSNLSVDHSDYLRLLTKLRKLPGIKKVFVRSGIRFDYAVFDKNDDFFKTICRYHISGQLRVAPEHVSDEVLKCMGKPPHKVYESFLKRINDIHVNEKMNQYVIPYLMSSHPGSRLKDAICLAEYLRDIKFTPKQVQDFYPTPSTLSTCMYYTEINPITMEKVYVPKKPHEKAMQRALMQYRMPNNYNLVKEALLKCGRSDLISYSEKGLIFPRQRKTSGEKSNNNETNRDRKKRSRSKTG